MFTEEQLKKYADTLIWGLNKARTDPYKKGDLILVRYDLDALPLAEVLWNRLLEMGFNPVQRLNATTPMEFGFYDKAGDKQLTYVAPGDKEFFSNLNGLISLIAPASLTHLSSIEPARIGTALVARKFLREIMEKREETGEFGWTLCALPTKAMADSAGLGMEEYRDQIVQACYLDHDDPAAAWEAVFNEARKVKAWLNDMDVETYHVRSGNTDLTVAPGAHRKWIGISGHNIPSFELFLSPDWRGTEGVYFADQPSFRTGNYVKGVRLEFKNGKVVSSSAEEGGDFVAKQLAMDVGAARLGEFSLTDRRFSKIDKFMANTLYDENYGGDFGNCHVAVGASYSDTYDGDPSELTKKRKEELGFNDSALHWDLVNTEPKTVSATLKGGGEVVIYKDGEFQGP